MSSICDLHWQWVLRQVRYDTAWRNLLKTVAAFQPSRRKRGI